MNPGLSELAYSLTQHWLTDRSRSLIHNKSIQSKQDSIDCREGDVLLTPRKAVNQLYGNSWLINITKMVITHT